MKFTQFPPIFYPAMKELKRTQQQYEDLRDVYFTPRILINVSYESVRKEIRKTDLVDHVDLYSIFWIENENEGFHCIFDSETQMLKIGAFRKDGIIFDVFKHRADDLGMSTRELVLSHKRLMIFNFVLSVMALMTLHKNGTRVSTFTASRNRASVHYAEGDALVFKRIFDLNRLPSPEYKKPEPGASGIRKKEHEVIGHYRTYKSGVKVWVRPHRRGDPSLGRVTSIFT